MLLTLRKGGFNKFCEILKFLEIQKNQRYLTPIRLELSFLTFQMSVDTFVEVLVDDQRTIKEKLTAGTKKLHVVSIVGMGGIGKTTIARKVYHELERRFSRRAFCCVSQTYDKKELLLQILTQVTELPDQARKKSCEDLGEHLWRALKRGNYLIVMDDMWDIGAWNDLKEFFPKDPNQSRILITSRQNNLVPQVERGSTSLHCLRLLSDEESWKLLKVKVFDQESCPSDLSDLGRKIAKSCQGLPLPIVVVAGILTKIGQEREKWEQIADSVSTHAQMECSHIFELSYQYLPEQLKSCFLYLAVFQEDFRIPVWKLMQLWIAEGFIPGTENLEDLAEDYMKDLVNRNLVMVSESRSIGGIKKCYLHDLMLEFCLGKAQEEMFMQRLRVQGYGRRCALRSFGASNPRLCCYYNGVYPRLSKFTFSPRLSSLLLFIGDEYGRGNDCTFISPLKNLTVLELSGLKLDENFFDMELPAQLRYVAVCGEFREIPASISGLSKLETLVVDNDGPVIRLPDSIWEMVTLRHLRGKTHFDLPEPRGRKLENLQTLNFRCVGEVRSQALEALPNLRNLKCYFLFDLRGPPQLDSLPKLESLQLHWEDFVQLSKIDLGRLPPNLRKLTIKGAVYSYCKNICGLPNLEVLKMRIVDFRKKRWRMTDKENFPKLKYLKLIASNIKIWDASWKNFPSLEKLVLEFCDKLEGIPLSFGEIPTLQLIDVRRQWFNESIVTSATDIQKVQEDNSNPEFKVEVPMFLLEKRKYVATS